MSIVGVSRRSRAIIGIVFAQLTRNRLRTTFAILGIVLAVLSTTLLAGVGAGVFETGQSQLNAADRDLWVSSGPVGISATSGGFENTLYDAHTVGAEMEQIEGVRNTVPIGFQTVYVSPSGEEFSTIIGTGVIGSGSSVSISEGEAFPRSAGHYADGAYSGPMSQEVMIDTQTAEQFDVGVGDTLYIGGTLSSARSNEVTIVGITDTFSRFLGTPTVTMPLSELQTITGTTSTDSATFITVSVEEGADIEAVQQRIQTEYPEFTVRSNQEQLEAVLQNQALVLAGGVTLVVLAFIAGLALTTNLLGLVVYQQRETLAALQATGMSQSTLIGLISGQGFMLGVVGGLLGVGLTPPLAEVLNQIAERLVGFEGLVQVPTQMLFVGFGIATIVGTVAAAIVAWRISKLETLAVLS
jgi:putative ABC transport system permease protein